MQDGEITEKNVTVSVVGKDMAFTILEGEALEPYIAGLLPVTYLRMLCASPA